MKCLMMILLSGSILLQASETPLYCTEDTKTYCHIISNSPGINADYAFKVANIIELKAKKYNLDPILLSAIFRQESNYRLSAKRCERRRCLDFGISQIYKRTAKAYKFDLKKLTTDLKYSIEAGAIVLSDFKKRYGKREKYYWVRYNCGTKRSIRRKTCNKYKRLVKRWK